MPVKTPKFWYKTPGILSFVLLPIAWFYQLGHNINQYFKPKAYKASIPVICIGNAVAGGSGKTPTAIALLNLINKEKVFKNPYFLLRGYGGETKNAFWVNPDKHNIGEVGDEALLLSKIAPTIVAKNRAAGAKIAEKLGADIIIMDDGLQNNTLHKDITFLIIDRAVDFGNVKTIPAGPLREPLSKTLPKTDAVITIGPAMQSDKAVFEAKIIADKIGTSQPYIAFAGLGRPEKFLRTLGDMNANIIGWHEFADHHLYSNYEIDELLKKAKEKSATLITTEKDHIRLPQSLKDQIKTLPIELNFKDEQSILKFITDRLN